MISRSKVALISVFFIFVYSTYVKAQGYKKEIPTYELTAINLNQRNDIGTIHGLAEDDEGYLWLAGNKGLHVFDGNETINYSSENERLSSNTDSSIRVVHQILKNKDGLLWLYEVSTFNFVLFNPKTRSVDKKIDISKEKYQFRSYSSIDPEGNIYVDLFDSKKNNVVLFQSKDSEPITPIYEHFYDKNDNFLYEIADKNAWIWIGNELIRVPLNGSKQHQYVIPDFIDGADKQVNHRIYSDGTDIYFYTRTNHKIFKYNKQEDTLEVFCDLPPLTHSYFGDFLVSGKMVYMAGNINFLIIDTEKHTFQDLSGQFVELLKTQNIFNDAYIKLFQRKNGTILLSNDYRLYSLKSKVPSAQKYKQHVKADNKLSDVISYRALTEDEKGNIYTSYYLGISKKAKNSNAFEPLPVEKGKNNDIGTFSLSYWKNHLLWNNQIIDLKNLKSRFMGEDKMAGHCTQYLQNDTLWVFKWFSNKLHKYDLKNNVLQTYKLDKKLYEWNNIISEMNKMVIDADGKNLWIAMSNEHSIALISKQGELLKNFTMESLGIPNPIINDIVRIGDSLWYCHTDGIGVINSKTGQSKNFQSKVFLNDNTAVNRSFFSAIADKNNNLYLGSTNGLLFFDTHSLQFYELPTEHPLAKSEYNRAAAYRASDNRYYFGSTNGLFSFKPAELDFHLSTKTPEPIKIWNISIFNVKENKISYLSSNLDDLNKLSLGPYENNIEISYATPNFDKKVYYSYRLKGQFDKWSDYSLSTKAAIYGMQAGIYTLEIKASPTQNDEDASFFSLPIYMSQIWYKKVWVQVMFVLLMVSFVIAFLRFRFNQKLQRQKGIESLRTKISSNLHDDIGTILSGLAMQSEMLALTSNKDQKDALLKIRNMSHDAMERMRDTVWSIDNRKDKYENLIDRMRAFAERSLHLKHIKHKFKIDIESGKEFLDPEKRQNVYLIFKEAITNICKHSNASFVEIILKKDKSLLTLVLKDNGPHQAPNKAGQGLNNMQMRAEKLSGKLVIKHEDGFEISLEIPV